MNRTPIDLRLLRVGSSVRLGGSKPQPRKPYPIGWRTVRQITGTSFKVDGDPRWLPFELIEELRP